jgi:predicted Fe-Mo cluster-binding NifX family protein
MKIAVTSQGQNSNSPVDPRFGRAKFFVIVDTETGKSRAVDNAQNLQAAQGAGIQAGRNVVGLEVAAILTGHVGPKAFATLQAGGVQVYTGASGTVAEAVEGFQAGDLQLASKADVQGHWA